MKWSLDERNAVTWFDDCLARFRVTKNNLLGVTY